MELLVFQRWGHLDISVVLKLYFVSCKSMNKVKFVHKLDMWEVVLEWIKLYHKAHTCSRAIISLKSNFTVLQ